MGYVIRVLKSKKWVPLEAHSKEVSGQKWPDRVAKNGRSEVPVVADLTGHDRQFRTTDRGRSNKDNAVQGKDKAVEEATAAASLLLKRRKEPEWNDIDLAPCGSERFQKIWHGIYGDGAEDERVSDVMERCIVACQQSGIPVPKPFFDAKRRVESGEADEESEDRSAGPRRPAVQI